MNAPPPIGVVRWMAATIVWVAHMGVLVFVIVGWALPWPMGWWLVAVGAPLIQVGWWAFDDACWLSIVEARLRGEPMRVVVADGEIEQTRSFVAETLAWLIGRPVSKRAADWLSHAFLWGGFAIAAIRLRLA